MSAIFVPPAKHRDRVSSIQCSTLGGGSVNGWGELKRVVLTKQVGFYYGGPHEYEILTPVEYPRSRTPGH